MLKTIFLAVLAAAVFAIYSAGGLAATKQKAMALFDRTSETALGQSSDWG